MKTMVLAAAAALLFAAAPSAAQVYGSDVRQWRQQERIDRGYYSGRLTPREARRLDRQQDRIRRIERRARYYNGGIIDPRSARKIERLQDRAARKIYRKSHNRRYGW